MEEVHQIVLQAVEQAGVGVPAGVHSLQDLSPSVLVGLCRGALDRIAGAPPSAAPPPFPGSMAERFRVCSELAASIKRLGLKGDLSFQQFLYPSEEESYRVLSFLLDKLSKSSNDTSGGRKGYSGGFANDSISSSKTYATVRETVSEDAKQNTSNETAEGVGIEEPSSVHFRVSSLGLASTNATQGQKDSALVSGQAKPNSCLIPSVLELNVKKASMSSALMHGPLSYLAVETCCKGLAEIRDARVVGRSLLREANISSYLDIESSCLSQELMFGKQKNFEISRGGLKQVEGEGQADGHVDFEQGEWETPEKRLHIISADNLKLIQKIAEFKKVISKLEIDGEASLKRLEVLKEKHDLLKIASELALDTTQTKESKLLQVKVAIEESEQRVADSKLHWDSVYAKLEKKKGELELLVVTENEELQAKLQEMTLLRKKIDDMTTKMKQREEQVNELTTELEKGTKGPPRSSYVSRITELIKNSKKQDTDIARIIGETRDLQRESNANQGRLKRTYAFVDELVFRDAKRDPICRQAYRHLTSIHQDFSDCYDKVFAMDKMRREIADLQATIEAMEKRPVDLTRIQADFDALVAENHSMEKSSQEGQVNGAVTTFAEVL